MIAEAQREFVDANVLVYAFDASAGPKQQAAQALLERLWDSNTGCVSVQVLQEFFVTVTKKVASPLPVDEATARIREIAAWRVFSPTADDVVTAIGLHTQARIGFRDAMIVLAAAESGCDVLWTEDLKDGQTIRGVRIRNPFADPQSRGENVADDPVGR
jgi:predicted nucleic acid-binding protein